MATTLLRLSAVVKRVGLGKSTIYTKIASGDFPAPVHLSARAVGFVETEIDKWLEERIALSRAPQPS